jgi:hypothetical protein
MASKFFYALKTHVKGFKFYTSCDFLKVIENFIQKELGCLIISCLL